MNITDLMINDYVYNRYTSKCEVVQAVDSLYQNVMLDYNDLYPIDEVAPVKINDGYLKMLGFKEVNNLFLQDASDLSVKKADEGYVAGKIDSKSNTFMEFLKISYVHELQQLMRLYGLRDIANSLESEQLSL